MCSKHHYEKFVLYTSDILGALHHKACKIYRDHHDLQDNQVFNDNDKHIIYVTALKIWLRVLFRYLDQSYKLYDNFYSNFFNDCSKCCTECYSWNMYNITKMILSKTILELSNPY